MHWGPFRLPNFESGHAVAHAQVEGVVEDCHGKDTDVLRVAQVWIVREVQQARSHGLEELLGSSFTRRGTHLRRDTVIPQWFQASKAAAASDGHAVHC